MMRRNDHRARGHSSWWAFWLHRVAGLLLALFLPLHFLALGQALKGPGALGGFLRFADAPLVKLAEWGLVTLRALHLCGGVGLLLIEFGRATFPGDKTMPMFITRRQTLAAAALLASSAGALAQEPWPTKPVRVVVPFAPGGSTDVIARMVGQRLSSLWNQPVVVENRAGAGGNVSADMVAKSPGDGYTLLMASGSVTINPSLYEKMPFDTKQDLAPITNVAQGPMLIVVQDAAPFKTLKDLIAAAKAKPGAINFASAGVGSQVPLASENFANAAGVDIQHVPYKGEALGCNDLISGQVQMRVGNYAAASALLAPNRLRALAVTSRQRMPQMPKLPTAHEAGLPNFENIGWFGLFAPAGTPAAVIQKVQADVARAMAEAEIKARLCVRKTVEHRLRRRKSSFLGACCGLSLR